MNKDVDITYLNYKKDNTTYMFDRLPGNARRSFHTSLNNACLEQATQLSAKKILSGDFIDEKYINNVLIHMKNKAKYDVVWSQYIFEVPDDEFITMVKMKVESIKNRKIPDQQINFYNIYLEKIENKNDYLPVPNNFILFHKRYKYVFDEFNRKMRRN